MDKYILPTQEEVKIYEDENQLGKVLDNYNFLYFKPDKEEKFLGDEMHTPTLESILLGLGIQGVTIPETSNLDADEPMVIYDNY